MKFISVLLLLIGAAHAENWDGRAFNVKRNAELTEHEYIRELATYSIIVLGEKHYTTAVQAAQANTIRKVVEATGLVGAFTTGWEFLNVTSQNQTDILFAKLQSKEITAETFIRETQGGGPGASYAPILNATAELGGKLLGMNLSRAEKTPVTEHGIGALDPKLLPPGFEHGTAGYLERFTEVMRGHATPEQISNYYDSQCLVDDVMAYHLLGESKHDLKFLIAGSFHTDFYDGAVNRIKVRDHSASITTVKIIDASDFTEDQLLEQLHDNKYGDVADYVYFVNNPSASK